jgi:hypothetical protein
LEVAGLLNLSRRNKPWFFVVAKNCRILQFKLRKAEKRNESMENDKAVLEGIRFLYLSFFCNTKLVNIY